MINDDFFALSKKVVVQIYKKIRVQNIDRKSFI